MVTRGTRKHIEDELTNYHETLREIERIKLDMIYTRPSEDDNIGGGKSNLPSNPTMQRTIAITMDRRIQHLETVAHAIMSVLGGLDDEKRELVRLKYMTKPQLLTWDGIAIKLNISTRQAIRWRDEIVEAVAIKLGWVD